MSGDITTSRDADQTRQNILEVALKEFSEYGLTGARVDRIAKGTRTTKGMIYYHFGDKDGLYKAVLEEIYPKLRKSEEKLDKSNLSPIEELEKIIDFTFEYHKNNENFVRMVMIENINNGETLRKTDVDTGVSQNILMELSSILIRGQKEKVFNRNISPIDLHLLYTSFCFYRVSNHHTVSTVLGMNMLSSSNSIRHKRLVKDVIIAYLLSSEP
ncbi:TetR/AcrR family transcriptional regulator [Gluconobacter kanchanaburiensis]|uniref:TetR family transcriptional regulator n=1 Tax=Gluconobacter kanchanaburiensis NBRC 103587 TaxID=1307948 RepID=A0A511BAW2_9PROT|nr:TetR family transcriptional regulator [Gluconobacter kanchanaburiensis]MBF0862703.1 TetR family transcriptional regulator [Gluconobacter kanchanaburiensis]GBR67452.1 TetR family transcriptional regulator [Gluconobacter kanchanaburiensis NBRC 103587]GEK96921.1 TetR family transcriptional regulator [Gluconobacter kanchanaburiensis NBRC 103587]